MPAFKIRVTRTYQCYESAEMLVESPTPKAALAHARRLESEGEFEPLWSEDDGGTDHDTYEWEVSQKGKIMLTDTGCNDATSEATNEEKTNE